MITFRNAQSIQSRAEALGAIVEGDNFPLSIKMPCRFRIRKGEIREQGNAGDYLIFEDFDTPKIIKEPEPQKKAEPPKDVPLKSKKEI